MANNSFADYSTTPALNTDIAGTDIGVGCPPADVGTYMRTLLAQIAYNVQGTPGLFTPDWYVGTLHASSANLSVDGTTGTQAVNFSQFSPINAGTALSCKLPGGVILNWGTSVSPVGGVLAVGFNRNYVTQSTISVTATTLTVSPPATVSAVVASTSSFNAATFQSGVLTAGVSFYWWAVGI